MRVRVEGALKERLPRGGTRGGMWREGTAPERGNLVGELTLERESPLGLLVPYALLDLLLALMHSLHLALPPVLPLTLPLALSLPLSLAFLAALPLPCQQP